MGMLKTCYKKASSKADFFKLLKDCELETYTRSGVVTGVMFCNLKFRFKRLGFSEERIQDLDVEMKRGREIQKVRQERKNKDRGLER